MVTDKVKNGRIENDLDYKQKEHNKLKFTSMKMKTKDKQEQNCLHYHKEVCNRKWKGAKLKERMKILFN